MVPRRADQGAHNGPVRLPTRPEQLAPPLPPRRNGRRPPLDEAAPSTVPQRPRTRTTACSRPSCSLSSATRVFSSTRLSTTTQGSTSSHRPPGPTANILLFHVGTSEHLKLFLDLSQGCSARVPCTSRGNFHTGKVFFEAPHRLNRPAPPEPVF